MARNLFEYHDQLHILFNYPVGYIFWEDLHAIYGKDKKLKGKFFN